MSQATLSGDRALTDVVDGAHEDLGGRAGIAAIVDRVKRTATYSEWTSWAESAMVDKIRNALRRKVDGVPKAMAVGDEYVTLSLFDPSDYEVAIRRQIERGYQFFGAARRLAARCQEVHGVEIDVDTLIRVGSNGAAVSS